MRIRNLFLLLAASATLGATSSCGSISSALAEDSCVTSPGSQTELGTHWYYHIDPAMNRKCWYLTRVAQRASTTGLAESTVGTTKKMLRALPKPEKPASVLPFDPDTRESLFRRFLDWQRQESVRIDLQGLPEPQGEEGFTR
jgi:hypothetical protein